MLGLVGVVIGLIVGMLMEILRQRWTETHETQSWLLSERLSAFSDFLGQVAGESLRLQEHSGWSALRHPNNVPRPRPESEEEVKAALSDATRELDRIQMSLTALTSFLSALPELDAALGKVSLLASDGVANRAWFVVQVLQHISVSEPPPFEGKDYDKDKAWARFQVELDELKKRMKVELTGRG